MNELRRCIKCDGPTRPGRFRCDDCQAGAHPRPRLRLVQLPGVDALEVSRARHPSAQPADETRQAGQ